MNLLNWGRDSIQQRGWLQTGRVVFSVVADLWFDVKHGTDTVRWVPLGELQISSPNKAHAVQYQATKFRAFRAMLLRLNLPRDGVFIDFGSGKGRGLLMAGQHGFGKVIGVEFSKELCAVARANLDRFKFLNMPRTNFEVVESDVTRFPIVPEANIFYFYNPFNEVVLRQVLQNIKDSVK